jgi:hypothetical protein
VAISPRLRTTRKHVSKKHVVEIKAEFYKNLRISKTDFDETAVSMRKATLLLQLQANSNRKNTSNFTAISKPLARLRPQENQKTGCRAP